MIPKILVRKEGTRFRLCTQSFCGINPAGTRLERGEPMQLPSFVFDTKEEALVAGRRLVEYIERNKKLF